MKRTTDYWAKRFEALDNTEYRKSIAYINNLQSQMNKASRTLTKEINYWLNRLAENNDISYAEAKKLLKADELKEFHWTVNEYIKHGKQVGLDESFMRELENASAKVHISRLEQIKLGIENEVEKLFKEYEVGAADLLSGITQDMYCHTAFEVAKGTGVGVSLHRLDTKSVESMLTKPWCSDGKVFSSRIWERRDALAHDLYTRLTQNVITGKAPDETIKAMEKYIADRFTTEKNAAGRLVMTETAAIQNEARKECMKDLHVEEYQIVATLDSHTSEFCQNMDGQVFKMSEWKVGQTAPPFHVNCRSCTVPYFDDEFTKDETRAARGEDGKTYHVPADMTYPEWEKSFVDGGDKSGLKEIKNDDTMSLKNKISDQDNKIDELKNQFSDATDGYSYDEWFSEFSSIEEGYGDAPDGDATFTKLKNLDEEIRNAEKQRSDLLLQKESRGQLDTGFPGKIPDDKLDEYNAKGFEQIKVDTGYSEEQATKFHDALKEYFGGDYESILNGETATAKIIRDGLDRMPTYDGEISRGMVFTSNDVKQFSCLKPGDVLPQKGLIESWSSSKGTAIAYSGMSDYDRSSVILECENNHIGVGVQHLSSFGSVESEVLSTSRYEVVAIEVENKYDYLSAHKEYLYSEKNLIDEEFTMKGNVVCRIKVKEIS